LSAFTRTIKHLRAIGQPHALFGAVGLAAYGVQRGTSDIDLLATYDVIDGPLWRDLRGVRVEVRRGDDDDNLLGCVKIGFTSAARPVDVVVPRGRWPARALGRVAGSVAIEGLDVPLLRVEDLVLSKVHSGSRQDVQDILAICHLQRDRRDEILAHVDAEQVYLIGSARRDWPRIRALAMASR
jgi:hypothetical protein